MFSECRSDETLAEFEARMREEGWISKDFGLCDSVTACQKLHRWYDPIHQLYELSKEWHPEARNTFWYRKKEVAPVVI